MRRLLTSKTSKALLNRFAFSTAKLPETAVFSNSFLNSANVNYLEKQYSNWVSDPSSVSQTFATFFNGLNQGTKQHTVDANVHLYSFRAYQALMKP